jgi:hypothetical protein
MGSPTGGYGSDAGRGLVVVDVVEEPGTVVVAPSGSDVVVVAPATAVSSSVRS